jgi:hypothetical protein
MSKQISERPILFSAPMVRAILENRKSQTRRVVKPQPESCGDGWLYRGEFFGSDESMKSHLFHDVYGTGKGMPYGGVYGDGTADRLWVRETWRSYDINGTLEGAKQSLRYRADGEQAMTTWKPSIFMPCWASRITLEITDIKVERLQDVSEADVRAEGFNYLAYRCADEMKPEDWTEFSDGWDMINAKRGYSWQSNPFVWCISFCRIKP